MNIDNAEKRRNISWELTNGEQECGEPSWIILGKKDRDEARIIVFTQFKSDSEGLYVSGFGNELENHRLNRTEIFGLIPMLLKCMEIAHRDKIYVEATVPSTKKLFAMLGAAPHRVPHYDENERNVLMITRAQLEVFYKKYGRRKSAQE